MKTKMAQNNSNTVTVCVKFVKANKISKITRTIYCKPENR